MRTLIKINCFTSRTRIHSRQLLIQIVSSVRSRGETPSILALQCHLQFFAWISIPNGIRSHPLEQPCLLTASSLVFTMLTTRTFSLCSLNNVVFSMSGLSLRQLFMSPDPVFLAFPRRIRFPPPCCRERCKQAHPMSVACP